MISENNLYNSMYYYVYYKDLAEKENNLEEKIKYYKRALFWLEVYIAYLKILELEKMANTDEDYEKINKLKSTLSKKLTKYLEEIIDEIGKIICSK